MDPTLEEKQSDQPQQKRSTGDSFAPRGFSNSLGSAGSRVVAQAVLKGFAAFLAGPGLPVVIAIISVLVFTFIIVGFGGVPGAPSSEIITPTPAVP